MSSLRFTCRNSRSAKFRFEKGNCKIASKRHSVSMSSLQGQFPNISNNFENCQHFQHFVQKFFRRNRSRDLGSLICLSGTAKCAVTKATATHIASGVVWRMACPRCRFEKCLAVGLGLSILQKPFRVDDFILVFFQKIPAVTMLVKRKVQKSEQLPCAVPQAVPNNQYQL